MGKPTLVFQAPIATRSGYGDHSRDLLKSLYEIDKYDIKILSTRWGSTPLDQLDNTTEFGKRVIENTITSITEQPDIYIQVTVANEFQKVGKYNIGITAGVETTLVPKDFIDGCNLMDLVLVPSRFTKDTLLNTTFQEVDRNTKVLLKTYKITTPIEVLFEGVDLSVFNNNSTPFKELDDIPTEFNFLMVGHWLQGIVGEDRKDVGMLIRTFCTVFKNTPKDKQPGLILKTSAAGFSVIDREHITNNIKQVTAEFGSKCPSIYLLFGNLSESEMNSLYNHPKVKSMVMFTKGEGYGRPLAEFCTTGKPIIVSKWSGHLDFLPESHTVFVDGELKNVHKSAQNKFIIPESKWFTVNYSQGAQKMYEVQKHYKKYLLESNGLKMNIRNRFSLEKMTERFESILDKNVHVTEHVPMELPQLKKV